jgi:hypothetical protein
MIIGNFIKNFISRKKGKKENCTSNTNLLCGGTPSSDLMSIFFSSFMS